MTHTLTKAQEAVKQTPGPWKYISFNGSTFYIHCDGHSYGKRVAEIHYTSGAHSFHEADARLIAAAPDLLEAAKAALDCAQALDQEMTDAYAALRAAIAKATGASQ